MKSLERSIAQLRALPPEAQAEVMAFIQQKHRPSRAERRRALRMTAGCLDAKEAELFRRSALEVSEHLDVE